MKVVYLVRCPGTGHSIEALVETLARETARQADMTASIVQLPYISRGLWSVWQNMRFVQGLQADVFHITGDVHYMALALPASRTVLTIHDCIPLDKAGNWSLRYLIFWLLWYRLPVRWAAVVTTVSEKTRQELIRHVGRVAQKAIVVANGCDPAFQYRPADFRKDHPIVLQIGTAPNKNLLRLIPALTGIDCTLILVGPLTEIILDELQKSQIYYRNYVNVSQEQIVELYESCDIVTFLSTYEGFGMPVLEANAVGRAVISSVAVPTATLAPDAACVVTPTDIAAIRDGILQVIHDDTYRQRLIAAGRINAQRYTALSMTTHYQILYRKMTQQTIIAEPAL
jgi:glycosyltransferase involved in cell wall biosynthesis